MVHRLTQDRYDTDRIPVDVDEYVAVNWVIPIRSEG